MAPHQTQGTSANSGALADRRWQHNARSTARPQMNLPRGMRRSLLCRRGVSIWSVGRFVGPHRDLAIGILALDERCSPHSREHGVSTVMPSRRISNLAPKQSSVESRTGAVAWAMWQHSVSRPRSSNRTCRFPASGFPTSFIVRPTAVAEAARVEAVEHRAPRKP